MLFIAPMVTSILKANQLLEEKDLQIEALSKKLQSSEQKISMLQHQVEQLLRRIYGRRSERLDPNQLMLDPLMLKAIEQANSIPQPPLDLALPQEPKAKRPKPENRNHPGRIPIPEHLERVEIVLDFPEEEKVSPETGKPLKRIGWEVSEKLEYRPGKLIVNVYKRPKYAASDSDSDLGVITVPMPDHPIEKCKADIRLLSYIILSKFADHLPLYRQEDEEKTLFKRGAGKLSRREIRTVEDMSEALSEVQRIIEAHRNNLPREERERIAGILERISRDEKIFTGSVEGLRRLLKRIGGADQEHLAKLEERLAKADGKEKNLLKAEAWEKEKKLKIEKQIVEFKNRMGRYLASFNECLNMSVEHLKRSPYPYDARPFIAKARVILRDISEILKETKILEEDIVKLSKVEKRLLKNEKETV
jgi:transposase